MPETSRRRGRGQRNGSEAFGHGRSFDRSPLPRRTSLPESAVELPPLDPEFWHTLESGLRAAGLSLSGGTRAAIDGHIRLLAAWNASINLTALRQPAQMARNHVLDSLIAVPVLNELAGPRPGLLDMGSGAGFPGLPLAVQLASPRVALVDSIAKKASFLEAAARHVRGVYSDAGQAPAQIVVLPERVEDLADKPEQREAWDLVVARAIGSVAEVAELGLPLVRRGGLVAAWKLDSGDESLAREIDAARRICRAAGGGPPRPIKLAAAAAVGLPGHCLVTIRKLRTTPQRYPRQPSERHRAP